MEDACATGEASTCGRGTIPSSGAGNGSCGGEEGWGCGERWEEGGTGERMVAAGAGAIGGEKDMMGMEER